MRLLVVGHTYLIANNQRKYVEIMRQCESLHLKILAPRKSTNSFRQESREQAPEFNGDVVVDIREFFGRSHMLYVLDPFHFAKVLQEFQPDWVHIEEDPHSAIGVESVTLTKLICPSAKISFFIWDNLARVPRFPLDVIKRVLSKYSLGKAEMVVCGNKDGELLLRENKGYKGRTAVLPQMGLEPDSYQNPQISMIRDELRIPTDVCLIGFVGRLIPEKGINHLLEALHRLRTIEWRVLIMGSGPLEHEITGKWQLLLGERLIFRSADAVPRAEVPAYIRALDIFVLPSYATPAWKEQFGMVLAEAMMAGVPCIGSSSGAIPQVIGSGGLIFKENDVDDLVSTLERLLTDSKLRKSLAEGAHRFARQNYTHAVVATAYLKLFGSLK